MFIRLILPFITIVVVMLLVFWTIYCALYQLDPDGAFIGPINHDRWALDLLAYTAGIQAGVGSPISPNNVATILLGVIQSMTTVILYVGTVYHTTQNKPLSW